MKLFVFENSLSSLHKKSEQQIHDDNLRKLAKSHNLIWFLQKAIEFEKDKNERKTKSLKHLTYALSGLFRHDKLSPFLSELILGNSLLEFHVVLSTEGFGHSFGPINGNENSIIVKSFTQIIELSPSHWKMKYMLKKFLALVQVYKWDHLLSSYLSEEEQNLAIELKTHFYGSDACLELKRCMRLHWDQSSYPCIGAQMRTRKLNDIVLD